MKKSKQAAKGSSESARAYIDRIVSINRKYGMGGRLSRDAYAKAVADATHIFDGLNQRRNGTPRADA